MSRLTRATITAACAIALVAPGASLAQTGVVWELLGVIRNVDGTVIEGATVAIQGQSARTDAMGRFKLQADRRDTITLAVRRIGYEAISTLLTAAELTGDTLMLTMEPTSQQLDAVNIRARDLRSPMGFGSFEERRAVGNGVFITREQIEKRNNSRLTDHLRSARGVQVMRTAMGNYTVRFANYTSRRGCAPAVFLDGRHMRGMEVDEIPPSTVAGIELYSNIATVPAQFTTGQVDRPCGTIVIWTREPGVP